MTTTSLPESAQSVRAAVAEATRGLVLREALVEIVLLGAIAREHVLLIGPPGTGKSEAVRRTARVIGGRYFEYLLGRFTEPSEIFGTIDIRRLQEGSVETDTRGMLPEAEIAFLDEVFLGSTAILNTLLSILNERRFRRGHTEMDCPLRVCVGASNALPQEESLQAFADRFLLRGFVDPIPDAHLEDMLAGGWAIDGPGPVHAVSIATLDALSDAARTADLSPIRTPLAQIFRKLRAAGTQLSDRRMVKCQRLVAAAAVMDGRAQPSDADLWPVIYVLPDRASQETARQLLAESLAASANATLGNACLEASLGPLARAGKIVEAAEALLSAPPSAEADPQGHADWLLRAESLAREIDAGFAAEALPDDLRTVRTRLTEVLGGGAGDGRSAAA